MEGRVNERGKGNDNFAQKVQKMGAYAAAFLAAFLVALVSASAFTPVDNSEAADTISVNYDATGYYINMTTTGTVNMDIQATADGAIAIASDTVNVKTNSKTYKIYVSMNSDAANGNRLNLDGSAGASSYFTPTSGSATAPQVLDTNSWGWALAKSSVNNANSVLSSYGFDSTYTTSTSGTVNTNQTFAAMPLIGNEALIAAGTVATTAGTDYNVYYGAKANTALASGTYSGTVLYTAVGEASSSSSGEASIAPAKQTTLDPDTGSTYGKGQQVTIATSLYTSAGLDLGNVSATIGGKECTNIQTGVSEGGTVNITCNAPEALTWGEYDVVATFTKFDRAYELHDAYNVYVPYEDMASAPAGTYTMQSFTKKTCGEIDTPKAYTTQDGTGSILDGDTVNTDVPEVTLKDARNTNHEYRVRKLADGNCWMADNLRLTLNTSTPLTSETSDIKYNMDTGRGEDGSTTTPRVISNDLQGTVDPLGTYSTDASTGIISWTPFADSQTTYNVSWASPYKNDAGELMDTGTDVPKEYRHFGTDGKTEVTEITNYKVGDNKYEEYARSYDNGNNTRVDDDGKTQYYGTYFNWYAATAGSGTYATERDTAVNSVCPRNWQLPKNLGNKSWDNLFAASYGMTVAGSTESMQPQIQMEIEAAKKAPFSVFPAGYYHWARGILSNRETTADYWTFTANSHAYAVNFVFYGTHGFSPKTTAHNTEGLNVRCVVR